MAKNYRYDRQVKSRLEAYCSEHQGLFDKVERFLDEEVPRLASQNKGEGGFWDRLRRLLIDPAWDADIKMRARLLMEYCLSRQPPVRMWDVRKTIADDRGHDHGFVFYMSIEPPPKGSPSLQRKVGVLLGFFVIRPGSTPNERHVIVV